MKRLFGFAAICALGLMLSGNAQASPLEAVETVTSQSPIFNGQYTLLSVETTFWDHDKELGKKTRQAIFPTHGQGSVKTVPVRVQTRSGNYATLQLPSDTLEEQLSTLTRAQSIVRILDIDHVPIRNTRYHSWSGFHFNGDLSFETPWAAVDDAQADHVRSYRSTHAFQDVPRGSWSESAIYTLASEGLVHGESSDSFAPSDVVTRAGLIKMVSSLPLAWKGEASVPDDMQETPWATHAVQQVKALVENVAPGSFDELFGSAQHFGPNQVVTRDQVARLLSYCLPASSDDHMVMFDDWNADPRVRNVLNQEIMSGTSATTFDPNGFLTREQMAVILVRLHYVLGGVA